MRKIPNWKRFLSFALTLCLITSSVAPTFVYAAAEPPAIMESGETNIVFPGEPSAVEMEGAPASDEMVLDSNSDTDSEPIVEETENSVSPSPDQPTESPESTATPSDAGETPDSGSGNETATPVPTTDPEATPVPDATQPQDSTPEPSATPVPEQIFGDGSSFVQGPRLEHILA